MRSTNPVLSKETAFQPAPGAQPYGQVPYGQTPYDQAPYAQHPNYQPQMTGQQAGGVMTIDDVITKSAITMGSLFLVAVATMMLLPWNMPAIAGTMIVSGIVGLVAVLVVSLRRTVNPAFVLVYAGVEGVFIGALTKLVEGMFPGIAVQAVVATFVAAGVTFAAYKYLRIRVNGTFRKVVVIGTFALMGAYLVNFVASIFGNSLGIIGYGANAGPLAMLISAVAVVLAVLNLIMDFDYIEQGIRNRAPAQESWRAAFGLTVTMVWLYTELLRILSYFRD